MIYALIWFNIRKTKESEASILGKIFTNYLHSVTASATFNVEYPQFMKDTFEPAQTISQSSDAILSFDCFIEDFKLNIFGSSEYIMKTFLACLLPLVIITMFSLLFALWKLVKRDSSLQRNFVVSSITIIYFMHPSLTEKTLSLFRCVTIYVKKRLLYDLELICWEGAHQYWGIFLAIPMLFVCFGCPIIGIILLWKNRNSLND